MKAGVNGHGRRAIATIFLLAGCICLHSAEALGAQARGSSAAADYDGLYHADVNSKEFGESSLVLSHNGRPIPPKENDPSAPTVPGFYPGGERHAFEFVRLSGGKIEFQTHQVDGIHYRFSGRVGKERDPEFVGPIPYLVGTLTEFKDGRVRVREQIRFSHAVIL